MRAQPEPEVINVPDEGTEVQIRPMTGGFVQLRMATATALGLQVLLSHHEAFTLAETLAIAAGQSRAHLEAN